MKGSLLALAIIFTYVIAATNALHQSKHKRSIELSSTYQLLSDTRLPNETKPLSYILHLRPSIENSTFEGTVKINISWLEDSNKISLHSHFDMIINLADIKLKQLKSNISTEDTLEKNVEIQRASRMPKKPIYQIYLKDTVKMGTVCELEIKFSGSIWTNVEGLFKGEYLDPSGEKKYYLATHMRPNNARRLFPCYDEPGYKVPFDVSISRPKTYRTLFNLPLLKTENLEDNADYVVDYFETVPKMATFSFGFVISQLIEVNSTRTNDVPKVSIWARPDFHDDLEHLHDKVNKTMALLTDFWKVSYPFNKLDIVALPGFSSIKPVDNWGLIVFKESDLANQGYYLLAQELVYQWLGSWVSPIWWSEAHTNKAIAGFLAASIALEIDHGKEFDGKWPMTTLYSIYYEFSKRYPHSRITGLKQETTCTKTELVLRMLNYTIGENTFKNGLRKFFEDRDCSGTFSNDEVWNALTAQAHLDKTLPVDISVSQIINSWISKPRLPMITVTRNYEAQTATAAQKVYLRERPHDVPGQEKMLWWIPLIMVTQDKLQFTNATPNVWLKEQRDVQLTDLPKADQFIIVNPEEIGPFPVNYDPTNWNLLSEYLLTTEGRQNIPANTRAKLLHDAWNLAYAGELSFATAFNMTLFMKHERDHLVWNPVFTLIDHIGNHIDMSTVHKKFETYVRLLLTPLYEELGPYAHENEEKWKDNLRTLARHFLCRSGYRPCIEEAQTSYKKWMDSENPDEGNPVPNQYICPVFKWGTQEEWEFGLQRVINFPASRKQSERTYLLKCLVGCPMQADKIEKMLNITILEENGNFTESDIFLEFNMLSSGSSGYLPLFNFLSDNWDVIKQRFENKTNLWDNLIGSATGVFTTQEGYDMVSELYVQRQGEFGSAEHIIEKSLRHIKEETKWSDENLPVIEKWLDNYLSTVDKENASDKKFFAG